MAELIGSYTIADKINRVQHGNEIVSIVLPPSPGDLRTRRIHMHRWEGNDQGVDAIFRGGIAGFEPPLPCVMVHLLHRLGGAFLDIGANTGLYSILLAAANRRTRVYAFEPLESAAALLNSNLQLNPRLKRKIEVQQVVVSDRNGPLGLYLPTPSGTTIETSASIDPAFKEEISAVLPVLSVRLDDFWERRGRMPVALIKVDTEGSEHLVLEGARELMSAERPVVAYELLERAQTGRISEMMIDLGYIDARLRLREMVLDARPRYDPGASNHILIPKEKVQLLEAVASIMSIRTTGA